MYGTITHMALFVWLYCRAGLHGGVWFLFVWYSLPGFGLVVSLLYMLTG